VTLLVLQGNGPATGVTDEYCIEVNKQPLVATTAGATANDFDPDGDEAPRGNSEMIRLSVLSLALTQLVTPVAERRRSDIVR
jgi:hypothetical protein